MLVRSFFLFFGSLLLFAFPFAAPTAPESAEPYLDCGSDSIHRRLLRTDSAYAERTRRLESEYRTAMIQPRAKSLPATYVLPVVFHIVHNGGSENITDSAVLQTLEHLNQSFANIGYYDQGTGVNTQIQFCLAKRTPDNQPTTGITRTVSYLTEVNSDYTDLELKNLIRYDPTKYINVWIVKYANGTAGYAYPAEYHGYDMDGIVIRAPYFGVNEAGSTVLTHEMGHYLGLQHTFLGGCANEDCLEVGDFVCDTPPDNSTSRPKCDSLVNSCTTDTQSGFNTDQPDMRNNL